MGIELGIASLVVGGLGLFESARQGKKSFEQNEEANKVAQASQRVRANRASRQEARKSRVRRAQIQQSAESSGTSGSSGEFGALSSIAARQGSFEGFLKGSEVSATAISNRRQSAAEAGFRSSVASQVSNLGFSVAQQTDVFK